jgi:hypothetical protein
LNPPLPPSKNHLSIPKSAHFHPTVAALGTRTVCNLSSSRL